MDSNRIFKRNHQIVYREEDEGAFLFDPDTGELRYMNQSGRETFLMLTGDKDINQVIRHMLYLYPDADPSQIKHDVGMFLKDLEDSHFILPCNSQEPDGH
jgi:hypothetical protein